MAIWTAGRTGRTGLAILGRRSGLHLKPEAVTDIPSLGFGEIDQDVLIRFVAIRVLNGGVDFVEKGQIVEGALHLQQSGLVEWIPRFEGNAPLDHSRPG